VSLTTESMGMLIGASVEVRYHVRAPKGAAVDLQTTNGAVEVDGVTGDSELKTTNGAISGTAMSGRVTAHTTNGSVHMALVSLVGPVELGTTNGSVSLTLPPQAKADLSATTVNGRIDLSGVQLTSTGSESRRHVEGMLNGGGTPIRLTTTNGSIRVRTGS
jgi:DUF4097 and DUF4098 domain-containing protein YvlB